MRLENITRSSLAALVTGLCGGVMLAAPATAQDVANPSIKRPMVSRDAPPSSNATINLINLLVKQNIITAEQATALIKQAEEEAYVARHAVRDAAQKAEGAEKTAAAAADAVSPPGTKRVTYVPEIVKKQLREEIRHEVMNKAKTEGWASPGTFPEWVSRIRFYGDLRARYEGDFYPKGNDPFSAVNFNAINTGPPFNVALDFNTPPWPTYNTDQDRNRARLRARLGLEADLYEGFWAGVRIATGDTNAPISFNQTLGGSGGNFSKYAVWLDRGYIKYRPVDDMTFNFGRFDNPFFSPTDLVYHRDLGFDGVAIQLKHDVTPDFTPFGVAGAFPLYNTAFDFGYFDKFPNHNKWMLGGQAGGIVRVFPDVSLTVGAAYYHFQNVSGELSSPCLAFQTWDFCDTDLTRPSFAQKGNTYFAIRNLIPDLTQLVPPLYQYFGLAADFRDVVLSGRLDFGQFHPVHVIFDGEWVRNIAWDRNAIQAKLFADTSLIPLGPTAPNTNNLYVGGNDGWLARVTVGHPEFRETWDWSFFAGYKWLESDAVIDAFADSDFGLGGTNLKGYFLGANLALGPNVWASARWLSANQIAGPPYAVDILQVDLNARF